MPNLSEHVKGVTGKIMNCHCIPFGYDPGLYNNLEPLPEAPGGKVEPFMKESVRKVILDVLAKDGICLSDIS